jgi:signal transduction histidine kinase
MERFKQLKHVTFAWNNDGVEPELSADQRLMAFRIFQEVVNNSMKHSKAKNISVSLYGEGNFRMLIKDDGKGFDLAEKMKTGGSGLKNIVKRASLANFKCKIETATEKGFLLIIE